MKRTKAFWINVFMLAGALHGASASSPVVSAGMQSTSTAEPVILDISPSSGPAGSAYPIRAILRGLGFMRSGNTVTFGPVQVPNLPSPDGRHIEFFVPKEVASSGEVPPMVLPYGEYAVTVTTSAGTSRPVTFVLTRGP